MGEESIRLPKYTLGLKQSAKGFWYADEVKVRADESKDVDLQLSEAILIVQKKLEELNK